MPAEGTLFGNPISDIFSLPAVFWIVLLTGFIGFLSGAWVWALRPRSWPVFLFFLSGVATLLFTYATTHYFFAHPLDAGTQNILALVNQYGASLFGIVMCVLLTLYPARLPYAPYICAALIIGFGTWTIWATQFSGNGAVIGQMITFYEMVGIIILAALQFWFTRNSPADRAIASWLGACIIIGSGPFIALVAAPITFGLQAFVTELYAFAFFNIVYIGFAIGLLRFRLFDLGDWAFQLLFHALLAVGFLAVDILLVSTLALRPGAALGLAAISMAVIYLPLRGWIWRKLSRNNRIDETELFKAVVATGLQPSGDERAQSWVALLKDVFHPLHMELGPANLSDAILSANGETLSMPALADAPPLILRHAKEGRALFTQRDKNLAEQLIAMIRQVEGSRTAYDRGASEERTRIARDIHDNIGAQLLKALHSKGDTRKDDMIRDTLSDLRDVINNAGTPNMTLDVMLADLRAETAERLAAQNIELNWSAEGLESFNMNAGQIHAIRSFIREAVSNAIKHANATTISIHIIRLEDALRIKIVDDGVGFDTVDLDNPGHGLINMRDRIESFGGQFEIESSSKLGTILSARLPQIVEE